MALVASPIQPPKVTHRDQVELHEITRAVSKMTVQGSPKDMILSTMTERVDNIDTATCDLDGASAFYVFDLGEVYRQQQQWKLKLPKVKPHYGKLL